MKTTNHWPDGKIPDLPEEMANQVGPRSTNPEARPADRERQQETPDAKKAAEIYRDEETGSD